MRSLVLLRQIQQLQNGCLPTFVDISHKLNRHIYIYILSNSPIYYDIIGTEINLIPKLPPAINMTVGMDYTGINCIG